MLALSEQSGHTRNNPVAQPDGRLCNGASGCAMGRWLCIRAEHIYIFCLYCMNITKSLPVGSDVMVCKRMYIYEYLHVYTCTLLLYSLSSQSMMGLQGRIQGNVGGGARMVKLLALE